MTRDEIRIGQTGRITTGPLAGSYLLVEDDLAQTGGYLILYGEDEQFTQGGDDWVPAEKFRRMQLHHRVDDPEVNPAQIAGDADVA